MNKKIKSFILNGMKGSSKPHLQTQYALSKLNKKKKGHFKKMKKWLYREHRGGLKESMDTLKEFDSYYEMLEYISKKCHCYIENISIQLYCKIPDERIGWERTYLVCLCDSPIGFCTDFVKH